MSQLTPLRELLGFGVKRETQAVASGPTELRDYEETGDRSNSKFQDKVPVFLINFRLDQFQTGHYKSVVHELVT